MIKNEKGITLITLIVTIIVLMIIISVTVDLGTDTIEEVKDNQVTTELSNVQQAIFQQYVLLRTYDKDKLLSEEISEDLELEDDINRPKELFGTRISNTSTLEDNGFSTFKVEYSNTMNYEEYYYILDRDDLNKIGITENNVENEKFLYIVNYSTGEVFDIINKKYIGEYESSLEEEDENSSTKVEQQQYNFVD